MADPDILIDPYVSPMAPPGADDGSFYQQQQPQYQQYGVGTATSATKTPDTMGLRDEYGSTRTRRLHLNSRASQSIISQTTTRLLLDQGYSRGLASSLMLTKRAFPLRIWIVDNSGSMRQTDGRRIVMNGKTRELNLIPGCSRWAEMQETVDYHATMAAAIEAPTIFRLLNDPGVVAGPQQFSIAENDTNQIDYELSIAKKTMSNAAPGGVTPLLHHMKEIRKQVVELQPQLRQNGTKIAIILATDGLPSDDQGYSSDAVKYEFEQTLRSMEGLPIWLVIRLFTDEEDVVQYWNDVDSKIELSIEVLDDFGSEALEIHRANKWLNYGLPLHRMREMGFHNSLFDLLDERKLSKDELKQFCKLLFGPGVLDEAPDPELDWNGFFKVLDLALKGEVNQWNPITKRMDPWIDMKILKKEYNSDQSACVIS